MRHSFPDDPRLPHLQEALEPSGMALAFGGLFRAQYPDRDLVVDECQVGQASHKPGKHCNLSYRLFIHDNGANYDQFFYGKMLRHKKFLAKSRARRPTTWPGCGFWNPVSDLEELDLQLHTFPYDPHLPNLGQLLEPAFLKKQVESNLAGLGLDCESKCTGVSSEKVRYFPGKRCVLRYQVLVEGPDEGQKRLGFYGKTYNNEDGKYVSKALERVCATAACEQGRLNVPEPFAYFDESNTLWQRACEGTHFTREAQRFGWVNLPNSPWLPRIAAMLAELHKLPSPRQLLRPATTAEVLMGNVQKDAIAIRHALPGMAGFLSRTLRCLNAAMPGSQTKIPLAAIHGTFRAKQVLCRGEDLAFVDFDHLAVGDPLVDVAEFSLSLQFMAVRNPELTASMRESVEVFCQAYSRRAPWLCDKGRIAWYILVALLTKIHRRSKRLKSGDREMSRLVDLSRGWLEVLNRNQGNGC